MCFPLQVTLVSRVVKKTATSCKIKPFFLAYGLRHVENSRSNCDVTVRNPSQKVVDSHYWRCYRLGILVFDQPWRVQKCSKCTSSRWGFDYNVLANRAVSTIFNDISKRVVNTIRSMLNDISTFRKSWTMFGTCSDTTNGLFYSPKKST